MTITEELPDLPLGWSLREHLQAYVDQFDRGIEKYRRAKKLATDDGRDADAKAAEYLIQNVEAIKADLSNILRFVDAENGFYGIDPKNIKPGRNVLKVYGAITINDHKWIKLQVSVGETVTAAPMLDPDTAEKIGNALASAARHARGEL